jgi:hypothetical protein
MEKVNARARHESVSITCIIQKSLIVAGIRVIFETEI